MGKEVEADTKKLKFHQGQFLEKIDNAVVPFLHGGKIVQFQFRDFKITKRTAFEGTAGVEKIGCLLPPYISRIQQRFALFFHRHDLPRVPAEAIPEYILDE
jgi:hypothetical protein